MGYFSSIWQFAFGYFYRKQAARFFSTRIENLLIVVLKALILNFKNCSPKILFFGELCISLVQYS
jgi:hypothetical protein